MRHLKRFWDEYNMLSDSRRWLLANWDSPLVTDAMFQLNHAVKDYPSRSRYAEAVYALKNELIKWLYENGYCVQTTKERQSFECWECGGTGDDGWGEGYCRHCDGTGVYREHILYRFVFEYHGKRYIWHQPSSLVTWNVEVSSDEIRTFQTAVNSKDVYLSTAYYNHYCGVVRSFLRMRGVPHNRLPNRFTLDKAIVAEWEETHLCYSLRRFRRRVQNFRWEVEDRWRNLKRLWFYVGHGSLPEIEVDDVEIPF